MQGCLDGLHALVDCLGVLGRVACSDCDLGTALAAFWIATVTRTRANTNGTLEALFPSAVLCFGV